MTNQRQALEISPKDVKALFRKAQAEAGLKEFDKAKASLAEAIKLEPSNKSLRTELDKYAPPLSFSQNTLELTDNNNKPAHPRITKQHKDYKEKQSKAFRGLFSAE